MNMEAKNNKTFIDYSKEIACHFLQTAVTVDDQLVFSSNKSSVVEELLEPDDTDIGSAEPKPSGSTLVNHHLDYQTLSVEFAKKGIVCSGIMPREGDSDGDKVRYITDVIKNADLSIIDWEIGDKGELAKSVIAAVARDDFESGGQLRLICVYTGSNDENIAQKIGQKITEAGLSANISNSYIDVSKARGTSFWRVVLISKNESKSGSAEQDLPNRLIEEFSKITAGLLSNAALSSIANIRNSTHSFLYKFNRDLDSAYLSHVLGLISSPKMREQAHEVAFDYAVELISEELKSELQISNLVKETLGKEILGSWPKHVNGANTDNFFGIKVGMLDEVKFGNERMQSLLTVTSESTLTTALDQNPRIAYVEGGVSSVKFFEKEAVELSNSAIEHYLELSAIECVRRDVKTINNHIPTLKQGTIISQNGKYYVCIQPLCDSVRLSSDTSFTFLRISKATGRDAFTHVLRTSDNYLKLAVNECSKRLHIFEFSPNPEYRMIKAVITNQKFGFASVHHGVFDWCGELKQPTTQAIVNNVASKISRVGLDTFEWLRFKNKQLQ